MFVAENPIGAQPGDIVRVRTQSGPVLAGAAVLYLMPIVLFFLGYAIAMPWKMEFWGGLAGFALGVILAVIYDRKVARKKKPQYTIVGY